MKRDQFTFYRSYYEALKSLPQKEQVKVFLAICAYALDEVEPSLTGIALSVFTLIRPTLDSGRRKAENRQNKTRTKAEQNRNEREKEIECEYECKGEEEDERKREVECEYEYTPIIVPPIAPEKTSAEHNGTDDGFETFWSAYPVKSGMIEQAYREYLNALDNGATPELLMSSLEQHKPMWAEQGKRFTPSAEKWLHNRGWTADLTNRRPDRLAWIDEVQL